jgi:hypothetical protein
MLRLACVVLLPMQGAAAATTTATAVLWQQLFCGIFEAATYKAAADSIGVEEAAAPAAEEEAAAAVSAERSLLQQLGQQVDELAKEVVQQCTPLYPLLLAPMERAAADVSSSSTACSRGAAGALQLQQQLQAFQEAVAGTAHKLSLHIGGVAEARRVLEQMPCQYSDMVRAAIPAMALHMPVCWSSNRGAGYIRRA